MFRPFRSILCIIFMGLLCSGAPLLAGERFTDNGDGTVTDHQLGVMWAKSDNQGDVNWKLAQQWVTFTFPYTIMKQYDNWRLPTIAELESLYVVDKQYRGYETDCGQQVKAVHAIKLTCGWIWSSETSAIQAKIFNFQRGYSYMDRMAHDKAYRALPVREMK